MSKKIKDTPTLYGKDAETFLKMVDENLKKDHSKEFERAKNVYDSFNQQNITTLPNCDFCKKTQKELGGLLFSPPDKKEMCKKLHVCVDCWKEAITEGWKL